MTPKLITADDIRKMDDRERLRKLNSLKEELLFLKGSQTGGGVSDNPAKSKTLKKQIARILTVMNEEKGEHES